LELVQYGDVLSSPQKGMKVKAFIIIFCLAACTGKRARYAIPPVQEPHALPAACDSLNVTYNLTVKIILKNNCYSCHSKTITDSTGNFDLETFSSLKSYLSYYFRADSIYGSKFMHVIRQTTGVIPMPPVGKLSPCDISKIQNWIANGAADN
jgi:hypothetical protein